MGILNRIRGIDSTEVKVRKCIKEASELNSKANVLFRMERFGDALDHYDRSADIWERIGDFFSKTNNDERAQDAYRSSREVRSSKGIIYFKLGNYEDALECIDCLVDMYPENPSKWSNKGMTLFYLGRYEEALDCFDNAIRLDPELTEALCSKGSCLARLGRYEESLELFDKAKDNADIAYFSFPRYTFIPLTGSSSLKPDVSQACYFKAVVLSMLGRFEEAIEAFDEAIDARPGFPDAINAKNEVLSKM